MLKLIERLNQRVWPVTLLLICVGTTTSVTNLVLTLSANRPLLISSAAHFYDSPAANPPTLFTIDWINTGKTSAHRGTATLFAQTENRERCEKLGSSAIGNLALNQSTTIAPGTVGNSQISADKTKFMDQFLVSIRYFDGDEHAYHGVFLYRPGARAFDNITTWLDEIPGTKVSSRCGGD
jgi:hypothetical protein